MAKSAEGKGRCACCGELITWRRNEAGTLSYFCQDCDFQGYAKAGTLANKLALEEIAKFSRQGRPDEAPPATTPEPKPRPASGLLMG
jgi:hypothetical protein